MTTTMGRTGKILVLTAALMALGPCVGHTQITISDEPLNPKDVLKTVPLVAYKEFSLATVKREGGFANWSIPAHVIYEAANKDDGNYPVDVPRVG